MKTTMTIPTAEMAMLRDGSTELQVSGLTIAV